MVEAPYIIISEHTAGFILGIASVALFEARPVLSVIFASPSVPTEK
jgi:hypothetical protein